MVYKLSWADFDGTKKLLIGTGGDLVRTNVDGDPTECCCPDECPPDEFSDAFGSDKPEWSPAVDGTTYILTGGKIRIVDEGNRAMCRERTSDATVAAQITISNFTGQTGGPATALQWWRSATLAFADLLCQIQTSLDAYFFNYRNSGGGITTHDPSLSAANGDVIRIEMDISAANNITERRFYINGNLEFTETTSIACPLEYWIGHGFSGVVSPQQCDYDDFSYTVT